MASVDRVCTYHPRGPTAEEMALKHRIDAIYTQYPFYGSRRITAHLRREGKEVNRKAVQRHTRDGHRQHLPRAEPEPSSAGGAGLSVSAANLICTHPNQVWGSDVTDIRLQRSWMYLVAVLDWLSPFVVSWELNDTLPLSFVLEVVKQALA